MKDKSNYTFETSKERRCGNMNESKSEKRYIYCKYIIKNGKRIYPKRARVFRFEV